MPDPYREPPPERRATPLDGAERRDPRRHAAALASLAGLAGASALLVGHVELLALAGAGAAAAAAHLVRALTGRRRCDLVEAFLGDAVVEGPGTWTSLDGNHRMRAVAHDPCPRWERLDPSTGETLASHRTPAPLAPSAVPLEVVERRAARVFGRPRRPRCFLSPPEALSCRPAAPAEADWLVLVVHRAGVLLERRDLAGCLLGDTLHDDVEGALRALAHEHPEGVGEWQASPAVVPARRARATWDDPLDSRLAL